VSEAGQVRSPADTVPSAAQLGWLETGTERFFASVATFSDADFSAPTLLPGWDRSTLLAHVSLNARALLNLLDWARSGTRSPMYPGGPDQRAADIAALAAREPADIRAELAAASGELAAAIAALPPARWGATMTNAQGREITAREVIWMRNREVWVHGVDLDCAATFAAAPAQLLAALLTDATSTMTAGAAAVTLQSTNTAQIWRIGGAADSAPGFGPDSVLVEAALADLVAYVLGRPAAWCGPPIALPPLARWL
jgi:maleylpyruvate isomerase